MEKRSREGERKFEMRKKGKETASWGSEERGMLMRTKTGKKG